MQNPSASVQLRGNLQIQVISSSRDLSIVRKQQFAAFIREGSFLLVWDDDPSNIIARAADIELQLVEKSWRNTKGSYPINDTRRQTLMPSSIDQEAGIVRRPRIFINAIMSGLAMILIFGTIGLGWMALAEQIAADGDYSRLCLIAMAPISTFFCLVSSFQLFNCSAD